MKKRALLILIFLLTIAQLSGQDCFPKARDFTFVYDEANVLTTSEERILNDKLNAFTQETSNVLVIVLPTDLCGYEKAEYSYTFGEKAGVGRKGLDNGIVLMVKPKEIDGQGEYFIAVGTGLQGAIPDITAKKISENEMLPHLKQKDYYGGVLSASETLIALATGEINDEEYSKKNQDEVGAIWGFVFTIVLFFIIQAIMSKHDSEDYDDKGKRRRGRYPWWIHLGGGSSGGGSRGWSGGGGGFGGFGGGGFSGGGAGGSW